MPDLIVVDGGKGQLSSAASVLAKLNISSQPVIGLAKRMEEVEILSVIEDTDHPLPFRADHRVPYSGFSPEKVSLSDGKDLVIVCKKGITSYEITRLMRSILDDREVLSLVGGTENYREGQN